MTVLPFFANLRSLNKTEPKKKTRVVQEGTFTRWEAVLQADEMIWGVRGFLCNLPARPL